MADHPAKRARTTKSACAPEDARIPDPSAVVLTAAPDMRPSERNQWMRSAVGMLMPSVPEGVAMVEKLLATTEEVPLAPETIGRLPTVDLGVIFFPGKCPPGYPPFEHAPCHRLQVDVVDEYSKKIKWVLAFVLGGDGDAAHELPRVIPGHVQCVVAQVQDRPYKCSTNIAGLFETLRGWVRGTDRLAVVLLLTDPPAGVVCTGRNAPSFLPEAGHAQVYDRTRAIEAALSDEDKAVVFRGNPVAPRLALAVTMADIVKAQTFADGYATRTATGIEHCWTHASGEKMLAVPFDELDRLLATAQRAVKMHIPKRNYFRGDPAGRDAFDDATDAMADAACAART